jgi:hypothetical protein
MMDYLRRSKLEIAVMSGEYPSLMCPLIFMVIIFFTEDSRPTNNKSSRPDTENQMVAMLSGQLHSAGEYSDISWLLHCRIA